MHVMGELAAYQASLHRFDVRVDSTWPPEQRGLRLPTEPFAVGSLATAISMQPHPHQRYMVTVVDGGLLTMREECKLRRFHRVPDELTSLGRPENWLAGAGAS